MTCSSVKTLTNTQVTEPAVVTNTTLYILVFAVLLSVAGNSKMKLIRKGSKTLLSKAYTGKSRKGN